MNGISSAAVRYVEAHPGRHTDRTVSNRLDWMYSKQSTSAATRGKPLQQNDKAVVYVVGCGTMYNRGLADGVSGVEDPHWGRMDSPVGYRRRRTTCA